MTELSFTLADYFIAVLILAIVCGISITFVLLLNIRDRVLKLIADVRVLITDVRVLERKMSKLNTNYVKLDYLGNVLDKYND